MKSQTRPLIDITQQAIHLLTQAMGPSDTMRFLGQFSNGSGNYTQERGLMFDHLELDDIFSELKKSG
jgi:hypothetical protein